MRTKFSAALTAWCCLLLALTGCASAPTMPRQVFNPSSKAAIKRIALLRVVEPTRYVALDIHRLSPEVIIGLTGIIIGGELNDADTRVQRANTDLLSRRLGLQKLAVGSQLTEAIEVELKKQGYEVVLLSLGRPAGVTFDDSDDVDYSGILTPADAVLDVRIPMAGYVSPAGASDYAPVIRANVRLTSLKSNVQLYFQAFDYGAQLQLDNVEHLPAQAKYAYGNFETLMEHSLAAQDAIGEGARVIAARIALQLSDDPAAGTPGSKVVGDPEACKWAGEYARGAASASGDARAQLEKMAERKAAVCRAQKSAAPGHEAP